MKPRIAPLDPPYAPDVSAALEKWMPPNSGVEPLGLFRTLVKHSVLSDRMRPLGSALLGRGLLAARVRELLILRTCARCAAEYEWGVHVAAFGASAGLDPEDVSASAQRSPGQVAENADPDSLVMRLADELHDTASVSDALWSELAGRWSEAELLEMIAVVGFYHLVSFTVNAARVEREPWAAKFPAPGE